MESLLISKEEIWNNQNTDFEIPIEIQKKLMNGNAQFIIDLAINLKMYYYKSSKHYQNDNRSYSITSLAIHMCQYFFYKKSYIHSDRFVISYQKAN